MHAVFSARIQRFDPLLQRPHHLDRAAMPELALRKMTRPFLRTLQIRQQIRNGSSGEVRGLAQRAPLGRQPPDPPVDMIPALIAKIDFPVLDDRIVPVADVERTVRPHLHIHRAKRAMVRGEDILHLRRDVATAAVRQLEAIDAIAAKIAGHKAALPVVWKVWLLDDLEPCMLRLPRIHSAQDSLGSGRRLEHRTRKNEVHTLAASTVGGKTLPPSVKLESPRIDQPLADDLQLSGLRPKLPHTSAQQSTHAVGRLDMTVNVNRLKKVKQALRSTPHRMQKVMGVLGAKTGQNDGALVLAHVSIGVFDEKHLRRVGHIHAAIPRRERGWNVQIFSEDVALVCLPIVIRVFEHNDLIHRRLSRLNLRIGGAAYQPKPPLFIPIHLHRLPNHRVRGEQVDLKALWNHKLRDLRLGIGVGQIVCTGGLGCRGHCNTSSENERCGPD